MRRYFCLLVLVSSTFVNPSLASADLVVNGDFEAGNTGFTSGYVYVTLPNLINTEGEYTIGAYYDSHGMVEMATPVPVFIGLIGAAALVE